MLAVMRSQWLNKPKLDPRPNLSGHGQGQEKKMSL